MKQHTTTTSHAELMSALVDGQLASANYAELLLAIDSDGLLLKKWNAYHVIGDVLRSPGAIGGRADLAFVERFQQRLSGEILPAPAHQTPNIQSAVAVTSQPGARVKGLPVERQAANDASFRWKVLAGLASVAAVGAIAWNAFGSVSATGAPELALGGDRGNEQVIVLSPQGPVVRDVRLEEFLAAHRQLGSTSAVQMPSGFLRNAAFDAPQRDGR